MHDITVTPMGPSLKQDAAFVIFSRCLHPQSKFKGLMKKKNSNITSDLAILSLQLGGRKMQTSEGKEERIGENTSSLPTVWLPGVYTSGF